MDCQELTDLLASHLLAELTPEQRMAVAVHVAQCETCREAHGLDQQSQELHDTVKTLGGQADLTTEVLMRLEADAADAAPAEDPATPRQIAGFELLGLLGRGGMGDVYRARQVSMNRIVALKILPARLAHNERFVQRLTQEAQAAARLRHPNIVQAYDVGHADGHYYFAMEYVDGEGLDSVVRHEGPLDQDRAVAILKQVASALAAAHEAGVIHRDIKPSNIILDSKGDVRVADFGLAICIEGDAAARGEALGTPAYAAPEICAGKPADGRADLYSLGATFFHILTGRPPFQDSDFASLVVKQVNEPPPALADVAPHLDPRLCQIIDRLLRKAPDERPSSAEALLSELDALGALRTQDPLLRDAPTMALTPGQRMLREFEAEQRSAGAPERRRRALVFGGAAVAVACAAIALVVALWPRAPREKGSVTFVPTSAAAPAIGPREHNAEVVFRRAQRAAAQAQWVTAWRELDLLERDHEGSKFYTDHHVEIAALRSQVERALRPAPAPGTRVPAAVPPQPPQPALEAGDWVSLFNGETLNGWRVLREGGFAAGGPVRVEDRRLLLGRGAPRTGIGWIGDMPTEDYELAVTARREAGNDSFCGLYFPVGDSVCTLSVGGYGGRWIGLANVDGRNPTRGGVGRQMTFGAGRWYHIRLRVTKADVQGWVDDERVFDVPRRGHTFTPSLGDVPTKLAVITWETSAGIEHIRMRRVRPGVVPEPPAPAPKLPERPSDWFALFDGKSLRGWRVAEGEEFPGHGPVHVAQGRIVIPQGPKRAAIAWTGDFPTVDYELGLEMRRQEGEELCEILFPVGSVQCAWSIGGWQGRWAGLSVVERTGADRNDTTRATRIRTGQWHRARVRVTKAKIEAWLDDEKYVDLERAGRRLTHPFWLPVPEPLALATWRTTLGLRNIRLRLLESEPEEPPADGTEIEAAAVIVAAKGGWFDTGLHLAKGAQYDISAKGFWGAHTGWCDGPEGSRSKAFRGRPLLGPRWYDLIGRVGGQGRPFRLGGRRRLTPAQPGRLYLRMNDDDNGLSDNWGSLRVSIRGPMVADKAAPLLSRFPRTVAQVQVRPGRGWTSSGIELRRGDTVVISAAGQWHGGPQRGPLDANGWNQTWRGQRAGALIGRIGQRGVRFTIGSLHLLQARESGTLYLALNDIQPDAPALNLPKGIEWLLLPGRRQAPPRPKELPKARAGPAPVPPAAGPAPPGVRGTEKPAAPGPAQAPDADGREPVEDTLTVTVSASDAFEARHEEPQARHDVGCRLLATLRGHTSWVISVAFSPDGRLLASGSRDRTARIWDVATSQCVKALRGHSSTVESVAFSPDGKQLLSGSGDRTLRLWDVATGQLVKALPGHHDWVRSVAFFPDGERVASTGADETVRIWELAAAPRARALPCGAACWIVAVSPDGGKVAVVNERGWIRIWDADTGHNERAFFAQMGDGWALAFSPDGQRLASAGGDPVVRVWDVATGQRLATLAVDGKVRSVAFSPDGRYLATADGHRVVRLWDAATYEHLRSVENHTNEARCIAFSPDSKRLATASFDGTVCIWSLVPREAKAAAPPKRP